MNIMIGKSIAGDFFIGKLVEKNNSLYLTKVFNLAIRPDSETQITTIMVPIMMPFDDKAIEEISVDKFSLILIDAPKEIENTYIKFTTGLHIVSNKDMPRNIQ